MKGGIQKAPQRFGEPATLSDQLAAALVAQPSGSTVVEVKGAMVVYRSLMILSCGL